jgi:hypothetical protein
MIPQDDPMTQSRPSFERIEQAPAFLPHCNDPRIVAMGLAPMQGSWVDITPSDAWRAHKTSVREQLGKRVYAVRDEGVAAAEEFAGLVFDVVGEQSRLEKSELSDVEALWCASLQVADDLVVMQSDDQGKYRLVAASVCSPSDWRLEEKLGATMAEVHGPIPRLNDEIGDQIDRFFTRLPTDRLIQRFNWSLMPHPDLMSRDEWQVDPASDRLWYRAERQSLRRLPRSGAIAFTIRVHICELTALLPIEGALESLWSAVEAAPDDLRHYKGLDMLAPVIASWRRKNRV